MDKTVITGAKQSRYTGCTQLLAECFAALPSHYRTICKIYNADLELLLGIEGLERPVVTIGEISIAVAPGLSGSQGSTV